MHQHEVDEGEGPDEAEQDAEADAECGAKWRIAPVPEHRCERRLRRRPRMHRLHPLDGEVHQRGAGEIQRREEVEIRCQPERVDDSCGNQAADQVAGDVAGDIGRKGAAGIHRAALFTEIGQCQCKCRCHAQSLRDAKDREHGEIGRDRQQGRRNGEQGEAQQNAEPAIDVLAQESNDKSGNRHSHGAGIDRETHRRGCHVVMLCQRGEDRLRCKQIDHGEEGR